MKKSLLFFSLGLISLGAYAQTPDETSEPTAFKCVADTWIRENNQTWKQTSGWEKVEIRMDANKNDAGETIGYYYFAALYGFEYNLPKGMQVSEATLRLVTERWKGGPINVFGYANDFAEDATWESEASYVEAAMDESLIIPFTPAAQRNVALGSDAVGDDYRVIAAWTNNIDVTSYLRSLEEGTTRVNFLLAAADNNINQNCFYTKEATDVVNAKDASLSFDKEDLIPVLYVTFVSEDDDPVIEDDENDTVDTFVRSNAPGNTYGSDENMEIYTQQPAEGDMVYFVGLLSFTLPEELFEEDSEVKGVNLRLVTTQCKGDRNMAVYPFVPFNEYASWNTVGDKVLAALKSEPINTFTVAGQGDKALNAKDVISDENSKLDAWTNYISITDYIQDLVEAEESVVNLMIAKTVPQTNNNAVKFATSENQGATGVLADGTTFTFPTEDIVPQLILAYSEGGTTEVKTISIDLNAPVEYFDLSGRRINNPEKGIYILRQGDKAIKVIK